MDNRDIETFLHNVVWLRKHHGLSKKQMAQLLGIGVKTLNKIEKGEMPPKMGINATMNIYRHFHISPEKQFSTRLGK